MKAEAFRHSQEPEVIIFGGAQPEQRVTEAIDLTEDKRVQNTPVERISRKEAIIPDQPHPDQPHPDQPDNTIYALIGLVFVGVAIWLGKEDNSRAVMPYYN